MYIISHTINIIKKVLVQKRRSPREVILEEYVDGFHFILSLGLYIEYDRYIDEIKNHYRSNSHNYRYSSLTKQFIMIYDAALNFAIRDALYKELFTLYFCFGDMLGFTKAEIGQAYMKKNEVNHQRQDNG